MWAAATPEDGAPSETFSWEQIMISAAEIPIGGPIGRADIDMSDACVLLFGTDFSDDERVLTSTTGSESNMAGDDEQVFYLQ